jgi:uncharacterized OB-fold protein
MRELVRAGIGRAGSVRDGRRVLGPDEDAFTLAATALERVRGPRFGDRTPVRVTVLGSLPPATDWAISVVLERPVEVVRSVSGAEGFDRALEEARAGPSGDAVVLAVVAGGAETASWDGVLPTADGERDDAAVAVWFGERGAARSGEALRVGDTAGGPLALASELYRTAVREGRDGSWGGPWSVTPPEGPTVEPSKLRALADLRPTAVSEGAYVPRPRYLENLPSRWNFAAERCRTCGTTTFPSRGRCRSCDRAEGLETVGLPTDGALVVATTVIGSGAQPTEFDPQVGALGAYGVVLAEVAPGVRVTLQLTDASPGEVRIGDRVDTRLRRLYPMEGEWRYGRKAVPRRPPPRSSG